MSGQRSFEADNAEEAAAIATAVCRYSNLRHDPAAKLWRYDAMPPAPPERPTAREKAAPPSAPRPISTNVFPLRKPSQPLSAPLSAIIADETEVDWIAGLEDVLEHEIIAVMAGPRGVYKSAVQLHWLMAAAQRGTPALIFSAEGKGLSRRLRALLLAHAPERDPASIPIHAALKRVNIATPEGRELVREECRRLNFRRGIILFDTWSKSAPGLDLDNNSKVSECLSGLDTIRSEFRSTIALVAHTGLSDQGRPKGASSLSQDTDAEYIVSLDGASSVVCVTRQRFKDSPSLPDLHYKPRTIALGYADKRGEPVESIVLDSTHEKPVKRTRTQKGYLRRNHVLTTYRNLAALGPVTVAALDDAASANATDSRRLFREARVALMEQGYLALAEGYLVPGPAQTGFVDD